jgi:hypothetical protein
MGADHIYVDATLADSGFLNRVAEAGECGYYLGGVSHEADREALSRHMSNEAEVMVSNPSLLHDALKVCGHVDVGAGLGVLNSTTLAKLHGMGASRVWLSPELSESEVREMARSGAAELGMVVSGRQELMVMRFSGWHPGKTRPGCRLNLRDRLGYEFPVVVDRFGRSHMFNSVSLDLVSEVRGLFGMGVGSFMLDLRLMDEGEARSEMQRISDAVRGRDVGRRSSGTTTGAYFRGVI